MNIDRGSARGRESSPLRPVNADRVRFVDDEDRVPTPRDLGQVADRRQIAIHREHPIAN